MKLLTRIVALVLVPCLIADPVTASAFHSVPSISTKVSAFTPRFEIEALSIPELFIRNAKEAMAFGVRRWLGHADWRNWSLAGWGPAEIKHGAEFEDYREKPVSSLHFFSRRKSDSNIPWAFRNEEANLQERAKDLAMEVCMAYGSLNDGIAETRELTEGFVKNGGDLSETAQTFIGRLKAKNPSSQIKLETVKIKLLSARQIFKYQYISPAREMMSTFQNFLEKAPTEEYLEKSVLTLSGYYSRPDPSPKSEKARHVLLETRKIYLESIPVEKPKPPTLPPLPAPKRDFPTSPYNLSIEQMLDRLHAALPEKRAEALGELKLAYLLNSKLFLETTDNGNALGAFKTQIVKTMSGVKVTYLGGDGIYNGGILIEDNGTRILIDFGSNMSKETERFHQMYMRDRFASYKSLEDKLNNGLLPRLKDLYRFDVTPTALRDISQPPPINAFFLTHRHEDHTRSQSTLRPEIPKYMSPGAAATQRTDDHSGSDMTKELNSYKDRLTEREIRDRINVFEYGKPIKVGSITVTPYPVDHSAVGSVGFIIETSAGAMAYSGDLRMNWDKKEGQGDKNGFVSYKGWTEVFIQKMSEMKLLAFFSETTNMDKEYSRQTEMEVKKAMGEMLDQAQKKRELAVVNYNWKNEMRMESFLEEAKKRDMKFAVSPKVAYFLEQLKEQEVRESVRHSFPELYDVASSWDIDLRNLELRPGTEQQDLTDALFAGQLLKWPQPLLRGLMREMIASPRSVDLVALEAALGYKKGTLPRDPSWEKLEAFFNPNSENEHDEKARELEDEAQLLDLTALELEQSGRNAKGAALNRDHAAKARHQATHEQHLADAQRQQAADVRAQIFRWLPTLFIDSRAQPGATRLRAILESASEDYLKPTIFRRVIRGMTKFIKWSPPDYEPGMMRAEVIEADRWLRQSYRMIVNMDSAGRKTGLHRLGKHLETFRLSDYGYPDLWKEPNLLVFKTQKKSGEYRDADYRRFEQTLFKDPRFKDHELKKADAAKLKNQGALLIALGSNEIQDIRGIVKPLEMIQAMFSQGKPFSLGLEIDFAAFCEWIFDQSIPGQPLERILWMAHASGHLFKEQLAAMIKKVDAAYTLFIHGLDRHAGARTFGKELGRDRHTVVPMYLKTYDFLKDDANFIVLPSKVEALLSDRQREFMRFFTRSELADLFHDLGRIHTETATEIQTSLDAVEARARVPGEPYSTDVEDRQDKMTELRMIYMSQRLRLDLQRKLGLFPAGELDKAEKDLTDTAFNIVYALALDDMETDLRIPDKLTIESGKLASELKAVFSEHAIFTYEPDFHLNLEPHLENAYDPATLAKARSMITQSLHNFFAGTDGPLADKFPVPAEAATETPPSEIKGMPVPLTPPRVEAKSSSLSEAAFRLELNELLSNMTHPKSMTRLKELFELEPVWFMKYSEGGRLLGSNQAAILPQVQGSVLFHGRVKEISGTIAEIQDGDVSLLVDSGLARRGPEELFSNWSWFRVMEAIRGASEKMLLLWRSSLYRKDLGTLDPNFPFPVIKNKQGKVLAVLITHAHLDHMWALYAFDPDVLFIMSAETRGMLESLQDESDGLRTEYTWIKDRSDMRHKPLPRIPRNILTYYPGMTIEIPGTPFKIRGVQVGHSVPADAFIIETSMGKLVYTGDLTYQGPEDQATLDFFEKLKKENDILWLMTEGSNVRPEARSNEPTRESYAAKVRRVMALSKGKPVFVSFKYYVHALRFYYGVAKSSHRRFVVPARLIKFSLNMRSAGYDVPDLLNDPDVLVHIPRRTSLSTAMKHFVRELTGYFDEPPEDPSEVIYGMIPVERRVSSEQLHDLNRQEDLLIVLGLAHLNELDTIRPPPDSSFIYSVGAKFNEAMKSLDDKIGFWTKKHRLRWEDIYISPHIEENLLMKLLASVKTKYLVPIHTQHPERFGMFLPDKRILIPRMLYSYPLLRNESERNLLDRVLSGRTGPYLSTVSHMTDGEVLSLLQTLTRVKTSENFRQELQILVSDLRSHAVSIDVDEFGDALRSYYMAQLLRLDLRRSENIGTAEEWSAESRALNQAILESAVSIARSMNSELTDVHVAAQWEDEKLMFSSDHALVSEDDGPPNEVELARLIGELMYQATSSVGINPEKPYEEKIELATQLFGPIKVYQPSMIVTHESEVDATTEAQIQMSMPSTTPPKGDSKTQTIFVPNFPRSPEWVRQPLMNALREGSPHVTVVFENLHDKDLALFKEVASGKLSPSTRVGHFKIEGHLELYKERLRQPEMIRMFLSALYAVHSLGVQIDVASTPEAKLQPLDTSNPLYQQALLKAITSFSLGRTDDAAWEMRKVIHLYKEYLSDKSTYADIWRMNWRKTHQGTLVVVREALQSGLIAKWSREGSGEPVRMMRPLYRWKGWTFNPIEDLVRRSWLSEQRIPDDNPQGHLDFGDNDRPTELGWGHLDPVLDDPQANRKLLQGLVGEILQNAYVPSREERPGQTLQNILNRLSDDDLRNLSASLAGMQQPPKGTVNELLLGKVLNWLVEHQKLRDDERRYFPRMNVFLSVKKQVAPVVVPTPSKSEIPLQPGIMALALGFIPSLMANYLHAPAWVATTGVILSLFTLTLAMGWAWRSLRRRWTQQKPSQTYNPDTLFDQRLTRPVKIYLTFDTLTSAVQYMEMTVLPWYIAKVAGLAWGIGAVLFSYQLLYSLAPITGSISDMYQKKNWQMLRSLLFIRMVPISILGALTFLTPSTSHVSIPILVTLLFINGVIQSWLGPLFSKVLKEVALSSGMDDPPISIRNFLQGMARALGPALAWVLFNTFIRADQPNLSAYAYWISAAVFGLMGLATMLPSVLPTPDTYLEASNSANSADRVPFLKNVNAKTREAFKGIWQVIVKAPALTIVSLGFILPYKMTASAALIVIAPLLPLVRDGGGAVLALLGTSESLGSALVSYINSRLTHYKIPQGKLMLAASFGSAVFFSILAWNPGLPPLAWYAVLLVEGFCATMLWEIYFKLAFSMKGEYIGRANGLMYQSVYGGAALGSLVAPAAVQVSSTISALKLLSATWLAVPLTWGLARLVSPKVRKFLELSLPSDFLPMSTLEATMLRELKDPRSRLQMFRRKANSMMNAVGRDASLVVIATHNLKGLPPDTDAQTYEAVVYSRLKSEAARQNRELVLLDSLEATETIQPKSGPLHVLFLPVGDDNEGFTFEESKVLSHTSGKKALFVGDIRLNPNFYGPDSRVGFNWIDIQDHHEWPEWMTQMIDLWNKHPEFNIIHTPSLFKSDKEARFFSAGHLAAWMFRDEVYWKKDWLRWDFLSMLSIVGDGNANIFPEFLKAKGIKPELVERYRQATEKLTEYGTLIESSDRPLKERYKLRQDVAVSLADIVEDSPLRSLEILEQFLNDRTGRLNKEWEVMNGQIQQATLDSIDRVQNAKDPVVFQAIRSPYSISASVHRVASERLKNSQSWNHRTLVHYQIYVDAEKPQALRILISHDSDLSVPNLGRIFLDPFLSNAWGGGHADRAGGVLSWEDLRKVTWDRLRTTDQDAEVLLEKYGHALAPYHDVLTHEDQKRLAALFNWLTMKATAESGSASDLNTNSYHFKNPRVVEEGGRYPMGGGEFEILSEDREYPISPRPQPNVDDMSLKKRFRRAA